MKILLTGASGFIGSHIKAMAEGMGHEVVPITRNTVQALYFLKQTYQKTAPDVIIHCGAYGNHYHQASEPEVVAANYLSTFNLLRVCAIYRCRFVYFSSSSVQLNHTTLYSATKLGAEALVKAFVHHHRVPAFIIRPSSVTGPGDQPHHLIPKLFDSCLKGETIPFVPHPVHDYIDVHDLVMALFFLLKIAHPGKVYNVSRGHVLSNREVLDMVQHVTNLKANVEIVDSLRSYDSTEWRVDNTELARLGFKYKYTLLETLERMFTVIASPASGRGNPQNQIDE